MANSLTEQFRQLGVEDPEGWAKSQEDEGIDQLSRATVLRALAGIADGSPGYWDVQSAGHTTPQVRAAAERIAASTADTKDLHLVLKSTVWEVMFEMLDMFDGSTELDLNPGDLRFGIATMDDDGEPLETVIALHESWNEVASAVMGSEVVRS